MPWKQLDSRLQREFMHQRKGATGATGATGDTGPAADEVLWADFTPVMSCGVGSLTDVNATGRYKWIGSTLNFAMSIEIVTNGTGDDSLYATFPSLDGNVPTAKSTSVFSAMGGGEGPLIASMIPTASRIYIRLFGGAYAGADATEIHISGVMETE